MGNYQCLCVLGYRQERACCVCSRSGMGGTNIKKCFFFSVFQPKIFRLDR